ncbi:nucleotidyltransferase domain-containing protein [Candidatus Woesearchaeota archaeon]|nr:nucleotidyltransferase domain-containing protein [Candidatus Woesearchaeota archaeon]
MKSLNTSLTEACLPFATKHKLQIDDIILFGSSARGKADPEDIDILLIFNGRVDKSLEHELLLKLKTLDKRISIISKTKQAIADEAFDAREGMLFEGFSLTDKKFVASGYGFTSLGMFILSTRDLGNAKRTRFYYALNGRRGAKGELESLNAIRVSDNAFAVPLHSIEPAKAFFDFWGIQYQYVPMIIPTRLARKGILGNPGL